MHHHKEEFMKSRRILIVVFTIVVPLLLIFGLASCMPARLQADFSHQGRLLTSSGAVVPDGNYTLRYRLFHSASAGSPVYTETKTVGVAGGLFDTSVGLTGVITPEVFAEPTWLEIAVNGEVLTPRQRLEGAPYASSLVPGAVIQGSVPITRTFGAYQNLGASLSVVNTNLGAKGGNGLTVINTASAPTMEIYKVAALQAIAYNADGNENTGAWGAQIRSDDAAGLLAQSDPDWYAGWFIGNIYTSGNCTGCALAYIAQNNGPEAIQVGDFVAAEGVLVDPDLKVPILQVRKAASASDAIVGVAAGSAERTPLEDFNGWKMGASIELSTDPAASGQYLSVVVQGLVQAKLGQVSALQIGDWIAMDSGQMIAAAGEAPRVGRLMSTVDETGMAWVMLSGQ